MVAVPLLAAAFFRVLLGVLGDRFGPQARRHGVDGGRARRRWRSARSAAGSYGQVLAMGALLGVAGASFAISLPLASRWYPPRYQGLAMGIAGAGNSGTVITTLAAPRLAEAYGWHAVFGAGDGAGRAGAGRLRAAGQGAARARAQAVARRVCARRCARPTPGACAALYSVTFGGFVGLASFLPILLHDQYGLSKVDAATVTAAGAALGSLLRPLGGHLADRAGGTDGADRRLRHRRGAAAVRLRAAAGRRGVARVHRRDGRARRRQRRGLPARRAALRSADRRRHRARRRRRRPRRLPAADGARVDCATWPGSYGAGPGAGLAGGARRARRHAGGARRLAQRAGPRRRRAYERRRAGHRRRHRRARRSARSCARLDADVPITLLCGEDRAAVRPRRAVAPAGRRGVGGRAGRCGRRSGTPTGASTCASASVRRELDPDAGECDAGRRHGARASTARSSARGRTRSCRRSRASTCRACTSSAARATARRSPPRARRASAPS